MKKFAVPAAIVALIVITFFFVPSPGKSEFKKQIAALHTVRSWKIDLQVSAGGRLLLHRVHEAQCPDMERIFEYSLENGDAEFIRTANLVYYRRGGTNWVQSADTPKDLFAPIVTPRPCMSNPNGTSSSSDSGQTEWETELNRAIKDGTFTKGEMDRVGDVDCRNWQVSWMNGRDQLVGYTMCINEQDHLPRRVQTARQNVNMYLSWNLPVEIKTPDVVTSAPASSGIPTSLYTTVPGSTN